MEQNLAAGIYGVTVTDANSCEYTFDNLTLNDINAPTVTTSATNVLCNNFCNGTITADIAGGTIPYNLLWSNSDTVAAIDSLCAGEYTITVTDNGGCKSFAVDTVGENLLDLTLVKTDIQCSGANGTATATVIGGVTPYNFNWSNGDTTDFINNLAAGTYTVTISDNGNCSVTDSVEIINPLPFNISNVTVNNLSCNGSCDGSITITTGGGITPHTFTWSSGATNATISGLCAGTYTITVSDNAGCEIDSTINLTEPNPITASYAKVLPLCDSTNGSITAIPAGGSGAGYSFSWDVSAGNQTDSVAISLAAGTYSLTISDDSGCSSDLVTSLSNLNGPTIDAVTINHVTCFGGDTASIDITASGLIPLTYLWLPDSSTAEDRTNLTAGNYTIQVRDVDGCLVAKDTTVTQPDIIEASLASVNSTCGSCNGEVAVVATGGAGSYTYLWDDPSGQTSDTAISLCADFYSVTVTDNNNCTVNFNSTVNDIGGPTSEVVTTTDNLCFEDSVGIATITPIGGIAPYSYEWTPGGFNSNMVTELWADTFEVTIADSNNCKRNVEIVITDGNEIVIDFTTTQPICLVSDGELTATATGGAGSPFNYEWLNGPANPTFSNIAAGVYPITVTDAVGCTAEDNGILSNVDGPTIVLDSINDVSCFGLNDGGIYITTSSPHVPLAYEWSNGENVEDIDSLLSGTFNVSVTDTLGCISVESYMVSSPGKLRITNISSENIICGGSCDGTATLEVTGGTPPYAYTWSDNLKQTNSTATGLCADTYGVTVTDGNLCQVFDNIQVDEVALASVTIDTLIRPLCVNSFDGELSISVTGGNGNLTYQWTLPDQSISTSEDLINLDTGNYVLSIVDDSSCVSSFDTLISAQSLVIVDSITASTNKLCEEDTVQLCGFASGSAGLSTTWFKEDLNSQVGNTSCINESPTAGVFRYYFRASEGACVAMDSIDISVDEIPFAEAGEVNPVISGITRTLGGNPTGPANATYEWTPTEFMISSNTDAKPIVRPEDPITYTVIVTSPNGCMATDSISIEVLPELQIVEGFSPNGDGMNDDWVIGNIADFTEMTVSIFNRWGQRLWSSDPGYTTPWDGKPDYTDKELPVGTYYYVIELNHPDFENRETNVITGPVTILR